MNEVPNTSESAEPVPSVEELERQWWKRWREEDYSWDRLAARDERGVPRHPWEGYWVRPDGSIADTDSPGSLRATLQDYWRDQADKLVEGDGRKWTLVHCPLHWRDGSPAKAAWTEATWAACDKIIAKKIATASTPPFSQFKLVGPDRRAQLQGAVYRVPSLPRGTTMPIVSDRAYVLGTFADLSFGAGVSFSLAWFGLSHTSFSSNLFSNEAEEVRISGEERFAGTTFAGHAVFVGANFQGGESFDRVTFVSDCDFPRAQFLGGTILAARYRGVAQFDLATFTAPAFFEGAVFESNSYFRGASFSDSVNFQRVRFATHHASHSQYAGRAVFSESTFSGAADFQSARFHKVRFSECRFLAEVSLIAAHISQEFACNGAEFNGPARFDLAVISGDLTMKMVTFHKVASFLHVTFPLVPSRCSAAFTGTRFADIADFSGSGTHWVAALDEAVFETKLLLDDPDEQSASAEFFDLVLPGAVSSSTIDADQSTDRKVRLAALDRGLKELEGGCRVVKQAMGRERNEHMEQRYYRFQLMARRRQQGTPRWEKVISLLYEIASDYGTSMLRPVLALLIIIVAFALVFYAAAAVTNLTSYSFVADAWQAFEFSWNNVFRPLSAVAAEGDIDGTLGERLLAGTAPGWRAGLVALCTLESLLAIVLVFLFALAVRRRFQIS